MMNDLIARCKSICGNNQITLHGEILIGNSDRTQLLVNNSECNDLITRCVGLLEEDFPCFKVEQIASIAEITIKIFAYQEYTDKDDFLDVFKEKLEDILTQMYANGEFSVQVNVFGTFQSTTSIAEFRYLNKRDIVDYKIVTSKHLPIVYKFFTRKVKLVIAAVIVLLILGPVIYNLAMGRGIEFVDILDYIPADHNAL